MNRGPNETVGNWKELTGSLGRRPPSVSVAVTWDIPSPGSDGRLTDYRRPELVLSFLQRFAERKTTRVRTRQNKYVTIINNYDDNGKEKIRKPKSSQTETEHR